MASISTSSIGSTSFRARVTGLDTTYTRSDRTIWWELYKGSTLVKNPSQSLGAGVSSSSYYTFSGLSASTSYTLYCYIDYTDAEGNWHQSSLSSVTVTTTKASPTTSFTVTAPTGYSNRLSVSITKDSNYPYHQICWKKSSDSSYSTSNYYPSSSSYTTSTSYNITGLSAYTDYDVRVWVASSSSGTDRTLISTKSATTNLPSMTATYTTSKTSDSITINVSVDSDYDYYKIYWRLSSTSSSSTYPTGTSYATYTSNFSYTITGLSPSTEYVVNVYASYDGTSTTAQAIGAQTVTTNDVVTITPWSWTSANSTTNPAHTAEATASQTTAARNACQNKTAVSNFKYQVWNDLVWKVSEARVAGGNDAWNNYYATRANTLMTSSSKTLTATRYNSLRYNIGIAYSVPDSKKIAEVSTGDTVGGTTHFLNFVTNYLNAYINTLT